MGSKADPNSRITDFDDVPSAKPLPLEHQLGGTEVASRDDSAHGGLEFISKNNKIDEEYQLPGGGQNSNATWVSVTTASCALIQPTKANAHVAHNFIGDSTMQSAEEQQSVMSSQLCGSQPCILLDNVLCKLCCLNAEG